MKVLYWNVYVGHNPDHAMEELSNMIRMHRPEIVGVGEAMRIYKDLHRIKGYRAFTLDETYPGRSDTAVLVRNDVDLKRWYWMEMTKWWVGPKHGKKQGPKRYWAGRIKYGGIRWRISIGHWPFNLAVPETETRVANWFRRAFPGRASAHLGDLNMHEEETQQYVKRFNGKQTGYRPDRIMYKNCHAKYRKLGEHGSDHQAMLFILTK